MNGIIKGLKSKTYLGFNFYNLVRLGKANNYLAYITQPSKSLITGADTVLLTKVHDGLDNSYESNLHDYYYQSFAVYENLNYNRSFGVHDIHSSMTYYLFSNIQNGVTDPKRIQTGVGTFMYSFKDKFSVQGVLNYSGSGSFEKGKRFNMFPSLGVGWVISEEKFMSNLKFVTYLKLRAEAGIIGYQSFLAPYYYMDSWSAGSGSNFGAYTANQWFGSTTETPARNTLNRIGNPDLTWEKRKEFTIGMDALMLNRKLSLEVNYFNNLRDGQILSVINNKPFINGFNSALPFVNYNQTRYFGFETGLQFTNKTGVFEYSFGGNATLQNSKLVTYDEPNYKYDYQHNTGNPADTYWGLTYLGKFTSDAETSATPQIYDPVLHAGDLKYKDMNGDGFVDDNDRSAIGHTTPRLYYALNASFRYKKFRYDCNRYRKGLLRYSINKSILLEWLGS